MLQRGRVPSSSVLAIPAEYLRKRAEHEGSAHKIFDAEGEYAALNEALTWLRARGFSYGSMQRGAAIGVMLGDVKIAKWRDLDSQEREDLHGQLWTLHGGYRVGPVFLDIRDDCPASVFDALAREPADAAAQGHVEGVR